MLRNRTAPIRDLADYDYRPARVVADADEAAEIRSVIDVDILGHIFEQSITDLERLRQDLESGGVPGDEARAKSRRKKEGAFYTPASSPATTSNKRWAAS